MPPPKKQDKKGPAQVEEDLSDLSSLPEISTFVFTTLYEFYMEENRDIVKESLKQIFSEESVASNEDLKHTKSLSRSTIVEYAQSI